MARPAAALFEQEDVAVDLARGLDELRLLGAELFLDAAVRAGSWLEQTQTAEGTWQGEHEHHGIPHAYDARVAWALVRLAQVTGDERFRETA